MLLLKLPEIAKITRSCEVVRNFFLGRLLPRGCTETLGLELGRASAKAGQSGGLGGAAFPSLRRGPAWGRRAGRQKAAGWLRWARDGAPRRAPSCRGPRRGAPPPDGLLGPAPGLWALPGKQKPVKLKKWPRGKREDDEFQCQQQQFPRALTRSKSRGNEAFLKFLCCWSEVRVSLAQSPVLWRRPVAARPNGIAVPATAQTPHLTLLIPSPAIHGAASGKPGLGECPTKEIYLRSALDL
ncbi:PREDICTED: uncharacterized protein LOC109376697 [Hipposideros armiger]|uniref:Uncharacterized protein LOC109376697 n=1 Tax=Hipposideros armiger TaxID=186990 RepID=A0A8B7QHQ5_HIPAR|nr:PREDICTED: uncharacterized protein LOC109376697 [Hipposideros armiger]